MGSLALLCVVLVCLASAAAQDPVVVAQQTSLLASENRCGLDVVTIGAATEPDLFLYNLPSLANIPMEEFYTCTCPAPTNTWAAWRPNSYMSATYTQNCQSCGSSIQSYYFTPKNIPGVYPVPVYEYKYGNTSSNYEYGHSICYDENNYNTQVEELYGFGDLQQICTIACNGPNGGNFNEDNCLFSNSPFPCSCNPGWQGAYCDDPMVAIYEKEAQILLATMSGNSSAALDFASSLMKQLQTGYYYTPNPSIQQLVSAVESRVTQMLNNLANGLDPLGATLDSVTPLSFSADQPVIADIFNLASDMSDVYFQIREMEEWNQTALEIAQSLISDKDTALMNVEQQIQNLQGLQQVYREEYAQYKIAANKSFSSIASAETTYIANLSSAIQGYQSQIASIKKKEEANKWLNIFKNVVDIVVGGVTAVATDGAEGEDDIIGGALGLVDTCMGSASGNSQISQLQQEVSYCQAQIALAQSIYKSASQIQQIEQIILQENVSLPAILPSLSICNIDLNALSNNVNAYASGLASFSGPTLSSDVQDYVYASQQAITAMINWYLTSMQLQTLVAEKQKLSSFMSHLQQSINANEDSVPLLAETLQLANQKRLAVVLLALQAVMEQIRQLQFYGLAPVDLSISTDIPTFEGLAFPTTFMDSLLLELNEQQAQFEHSYAPTTLEDCWVEINVTEADYPLFFEQLQTNGTGYSLTLQMFQDLTYARVSVAQLRAYLQFDDGYVPPQGVPIGLTVTHAGFSQFMNESGDSWAFSHQTVPYEFMYNAETLCPFTTNPPPENPLIPYIYYAPYTSWNVDVMGKGKSMDLSSIVGITFQMQLYYVFQNGDPQITPFFEGYNQSYCASEPYCQNGSAQEKQTHSIVIHE